MSRVLERNGFYTTEQLDLLAAQNVIMYADVPALGTTLWLHIPVDDPLTGKMTDTVIEVRPVAYRFTDPHDANMIVVARIAGTELWSEISLPEAYLSSSSDPLTFEMRDVFKPVIVDEPADVPTGSNVVQFRR